MKFCPLHESGLADALKQLGIPRVDPRFFKMRTHAGLLIFEQARNNDAPLVIKTIKCREGFPAGCLICRFDASEWLLAAATDVVEYWKEHGPPPEP